MLFLSSFPFCMSIALMFFFMSLFLLLSIFCEFFIYYFPKITVDIFSFSIANFFYFLRRVRYSFQQNSGCNENTRSCPLQLLCTWFEPYTYRWRFWKSSTSCSSFRKRESHSKNISDSRAMKYQRNKRNCWRDGKIWRR